MNNEEDQQSVEKITKRFKKPAEKRDSVSILREKYEQRRKAIKRFTDHLQKTGGFVDDAELEPLREAGLNEDEIRELVKEHKA